MKIFLRQLIVAAFAAMALAACAQRGDSDGTPKPFILTFFGFRADVRTITVSVPQMGSPGCSQRVQDALSKTEGVRSTKPDVEKRKIDITYDAIKLGIKNIEYVIASSGFDANDTPGAVNVRTNLPPECR